MSVFPGIFARDVPTARLRARILERPASGAPEANVVFVHGNVSSSLFWQPTMLDLPAGLRAIAVDLRGFGGSETLPVDATRGVRDFSDDVAAVLDVLGTGPVHLVGWSMGGGVAMQLLLDRPDLVASLALVAPVSPYGFGGTRRDGSLAAADGAGTGGGGANPAFVQRLAAGETDEVDGTSPLAVYRSTYVAPGFASPHEAVWVESMCSTVTGVDNYPGDSAPSPHWPGFAPGGRGVLNTMAPTVFDTSGIVDLPRKPPILWMHGTADAIVGDESLFDLAQLGRLGIVPGWPGEEVAPPQPMVSQTRDVLARYAERGGAFAELELDGCGHSPHLERPAEFRAALLGLIGLLTGREAAVRP